MTVSALAGPLPALRADQSAPSAATRKVDAGSQTQAFEAAMQAAPVSADATLDEVNFHHQSSRSAELKPLQKFEAFVLRNFVESMLPSKNTAFFGTGTAGNIWRSMLAERIGDEMAKAGGVGIAEMLEKDGRGGGKAPVVDTTKA
ncbi:rod-binding protein [Aureimonas phyllosphaerae]|uniref:Flagellar protein FlgJ N-terminal domain-containing protein n=1 Tax=Aureimonas phyllosphaerae TaxID=1166078 RepID=A0A7W6FU88_9HYPH|nr:rod-binding protein [Aureimonas phyllosphaerae]MBB3935550.1 hypothetical protein [Aureimonas phyllosphaerae]MBB3959558.1 hypothetical protein [Aureimonas phyllosphaerae]SFF12128.1 Rod binding protein [Aureimonas phyllosphaerae]